MKRDRKRAIRNYDCYDEYDYRHYGLIVKKDKLRIDVKRIPKCYLMPFDYNIIERMKQIPRNTQYFFPKKIKRNEYMCNIFKDYIDFLIEQWNTEFKVVIEKIKTPQEIKENSYFNDMMTGIWESDECEERSWFPMIKRISKYNAVIASIYGQYLHYIGSMIEHVMIKVITLNGYKDNSFKQKLLKDYVKKNYSINIKKIPNYLLYERFYNLWNFIKHNNVNVYRILKKSYPEILINEEFQNGDYSLRFVKLSDELIMSNLKGLGDFFNSFCEAVYKENCEEASWNYDEYFFNAFKDWKEDMQCEL